MALPQGVNAQNSTAEPKPKDVLALMKQTADWQLSHPYPQIRLPRPAADWTLGVYWAGIMALYNVSHDKTYLNATMEMGKSLGWMPGERTYHADDHAICQTYCELYLQNKDPQIIAPTKQLFDLIINNPRPGTLQFKTPGSQYRWSWCDSLFMSPPALARLYAATGDKKYLQFLDQEWWKTADYLYDKDEHFFFRDSTFFTKTAANGKKVFWGRGNGWVYAGTARVLDYLPEDYSSRGRYIQLFREMTESIVKAQQPDGLWRTSLLDPEQIPNGETSASAFFCYGLAWGINHGILDSSTYWPIVCRAWEALSKKVHPDGMLGCVQRIGDSPGSFDENSTETYGIGAFLLAGSEVYKHLKSSNH